MSESLSQLLKRGGFSFLVKSRSDSAKNHPALDAWMRSAAAPVDLSDKRLQNMTAGVLARLDSVPAPPRRRFAWRELLPRYAVQMATAALLGVLLGAALPQKEETVQQPPLVSLISASAPSQPLGF